MVLLDRREPPELCVQLSRLCIPSNCGADIEFGDLFWQGYSYDTGEPILIGVERKHIGDLVQSMRNRRLSGHQFRGMWETYGDVRLIVEDIWRAGPAGEIEIPYGRAWSPLYAGNSDNTSRTAITFRQVISYLTTLQIKHGVCVYQTSDLRQTANLIAAWWHASQKLEHHSGDQLYAPGPEIEAPGHGRRVGYSTLEKPTTLWKMAAQLPGIDRKAKEVARHFGTVAAMVEATEKDWKQIAGIGPKIAAACFKAIHEKEEM